MFGIVRVFVPGAAGLILLTIPVGIGMGLGNALLPVGVKERFADRPVFATGVYAAGINVGATVVVRGGGAARARARKLARPAARLLGRHDRRCSSSGSC